MYALVDCNNFFVSCERVFDPSLRGKPVAILSNNDGCVISRSNELKALGIPMGMPMFQLRERIERDHILIRSVNFDLYGDLSRRVMAVLATFTPDLEIYSIDEAFLRLSEISESDLLTLAQTIREKILQYVGIPVGIGLAPTKTLAKIAADIAKKNRGVFLLPADPSPILAELPVGEVWGIGHRLSAACAQIGVSTAGRLRELEDEFVQKKFSVNVMRTVLELRGIPALEESNPEDSLQSVSVSRCFGQTVTAFEDLVESIAVYTARAAAKLRREKCRASGISVYFQYYPEYGVSESAAGISSFNLTFPEPLNETAPILSMLTPKLRSIFISGKRYKKSGVVFFGLLPSDTVQPDLFNTHVSTENQQLYALIDQLNQRHGRNTLFLLSEGIKRPWSMKHEHLSAACTTDWNQLLTVH